MCKKIIWILLFLYFFQDEPGRRNNFRNCHRHFFFSSHCDKHFQLDVHSWPVRQTCLMTRPLGNFRLLFYTIPFNFFAKTINHILFYPMGYDLKKSKLELESGYWKPPSSGSFRGHKSDISNIASQQTTCQSHTDIHKNRTRRLVSRVNLIKNAPQMLAATWRCQSLG